ncbi:MAG: hypothetical protein JWP34_1193, partial [Massilia sp.]|nr:hypothetical protein [Massilia sp.]
MIRPSLQIAAPLALALALSLALGGCMSLAPTYQRPAAPVAPAFPDLPA